MKYIKYSLCTASLLLLMQGISIAEKRDTKQSGHNVASYQTVAYTHEMSALDLIRGLEQEVQKPKATINRKVALHYADQIGKNLNFADSNMQKASYNLTKVERTSLQEDQNAWREAQSTARKQQVALVKELSKDSFDADLVRAQVAALRMNIDRATSVHNQILASLGIPSIADTEMLAQMKSSAMERSVPVKREKVFDSEKANEIMEREFRND